MHLLSLMVHVVLHSLVATGTTGESSRNVVVLGSMLLWPCPAVVVPGIGYITCRACHLGFSSSRGTLCNPWFPRNYPRVLLAWGGYPLKSLYGQIQGIAWTYSIGAARSSSRSTAGDSNTRVSEDLKGDSIMSTAVYCSR